MGEPGSFERRAFVAVVLAGVLGVVAAFGIAAVLDSRHAFCDYQVGGEAGSGQWVCSDGIAYVLPTTLAAASTAAVVLLAFVALELRRGGRAAAGRLSAAARRLAGFGLGAGTLFLLAMGVPAWIALPYAALAAAACWVASLGLRVIRRNHDNPTSLTSHSGVQSLSGGEG